MIVNRKNPAQNKSKLHTATDLLRYVLRRGAEILRHAHVAQVCTRNSSIRKPTSSTATTRSSTRKTYVLGVALATCTRPTRRPISFKYARISASNC